jgi:trans-aconitate 2-methyltransferase
MPDAAKDFAPIAGDYEFFMAHSSEASSDVRDYHAELQHFAERDPIRMLDFGCGAGDFTERFLRHAGWNRERLHLSLVEPVAEHRARAAERLRPFSATSIPHGGGLSALGEAQFDLVLSNHVFYYVPDVAEAIRALAAALLPDGLFLAAIAGRDNAMFRFWEQGFADAGEPIPYRTAEDFETGLQRCKLAYRKKASHYDLTFPDSRENRLKIVRFLCADHLPRMNVDNLLARFDDFAHDDQVEMQTYCQHFAVPAGA